MDNITEQLEAILRQGAGYMTLSQVQGRLGAPVKKRLGLPPKPTSAQIQDGLSPYLGERLTFRKGGRYVYLVSKISDEDLLFRIVENRSGKTPGTIGRNIPFGKKDFLDVLNRLLEKGRVRVKKLSDSYLPSIEPVLSAPPVAVPSESPESPASTEDFSEEAFHAAYRQLAQGRFSVRIYDLRRYLGWPRETFDAMLKALRDAQIVQLQSGESENLTARDVGDAFRDESGFLRLTLMWS